MAHDRFSFWVDRGGTFTDVVAVSPRGEVQTIKLLSEVPGRSGDAVVLAIREVLGLSPGAPVPPERVEEVRMGTTVATNALLQRVGTPTVLVVNRGLRDVLWIGHQARPDLFALHIQRPPPLYGRVVETSARLDARGEEITPLDLEALRPALLAARREGFEACAVALMFAYLRPDHEAAVAELARSLGFGQVTCSHEVSRTLRLLPRAHTAVADAWLGPTLRRHVDTLQAELGAGVRLSFMQSNGGLVDAAAFAGRDAVLSGPAGGLVGAVEVGRAAGFDHIVALDMGGTSTDVSLYAGAFERVDEAVVDGVQLRVPMLSIHTVAAGGGSILRVDGGRCLVGPASAGADPGPRAYRRGGPLTVTDANLLLGRIQTSAFPRVFGPKADQPLDRDDVCTAFDALAAEVGRVAGESRSVEVVAEGFLRVAIDHMAAAVRRISTERGHDLRDYTLVAFGGAGGQHACALARELGLRRIVSHPMAGVLSALGMGLADARVVLEHTVEQALDPDGLQVARGVAATLEGEARARLLRQGLPGIAIEVVARLKLRYLGTDTPLGTPLLGDVLLLRDAFDEAHLRRFGFRDPTRTVVVGAVEVEAVARMPRPRWAPETGPVSGAPELVDVWLEGAWRRVPMYRRVQLGVGQRIGGPALVAEATSTTFVEPGWVGTVGAAGELVLEDTGGAAPEARSLDAGVDPVRLTLFDHQFRAIAEEMGLVLQSTAQSVNIKERLDFSCAIFDEAGRLVANAPHIPVHLGSMGESVRAVIRRWEGAMAPGDAYLLNDPFQGGTHLPDVTVVSPVFGPGGGGPRFFVASRGHHADLGGVTPGSMPPFSTRVDEEGVCFRGEPLVRAGRFDEAGLRSALAAGPWPARNPEQNVADLRAQLAANTRGAQALLEMCKRHGPHTVSAYMVHVRAAAAEAVRRVLGRLGSGRRVVPIDGGGQIAVSVEVDRDARAARIDFTGTSAQREDNFNAPRAICMAAVLYAVRTLVGEDVPLNDGCLEPLEVIIPPGSVLDPRPPAAVVAGNVETSQLVVDALLGAVGALAASQGTMNSLTFGDLSHQYYETLCGGAGAGPGFEGASAVHTHMTNSRLTDPEVLELRFPVRVEAFGVRAGSGGAGRWRGGDGAIRRIRFLAPMTVALLSGRRQHAPFGLAGGGDGAPGRGWIERVSGALEVLGGRAQTEVAPGDLLIVETPGGGGYGIP